MAGEFILCCWTRLGACLDEYLCQSFLLKRGLLHFCFHTCSTCFCQGLLVSLMSELCGTSRGLMLVQFNVPELFVGRTYAELFQHMTLRKCMIPLGLYRRKVENPAWRLQYVVTNPPGDELLLPGDKVYIIRDGSA